MEDTWNTRMFHDEEFECAECDYKAGTETEIMDHSAMHRSVEDSMLASANNISIPQRDINTNYYDESVSVNMKHECKSGSEIEGDRMAKPMHGISKKYIKNHKCGVKRDSDNYEINSQDRDLGISICENKKIKLEGIDIDDNFKLYFSSTELTDNEVIKQESDPLELKRLDHYTKSLKVENKALLKAKRLKIRGVVVEVDNTGKYIPDGWERKVYQTAKGSGKCWYRVIFISPTGKILHNRSHVSIYVKSHGINKCTVDVKQMDFSVLSHNLPNNKEKPKRNRVNIEVDNTDVYIPEGWKRKAFQYLSSAREKRICYISPFKREIFCKIGMKDYLEKLENEGHFLSVDIERLDFSKQSISGEEIEIDNTGKYIPDGWQRKVFRGIEGTGKGWYRVIYISSTGKILYNKTDLSQYIKRLEKQGIKCPVEIEQIDYSTASHNLRKPERKYKVEIEIDNTNIYIPEGWKRKAFKYLKGKMHTRVYYISPSNYLIDSKKNMNKYLKQMKKSDHSFSIDIDHLNFSVAALTT